MLVSERMQFWEPNENKNWITSWILFMQKEKKEKRWEKSDL